MLASLVQPAGTVVSLDIDPALTSRAAGLLGGFGIQNAIVLAADGRADYAPGGPFDRIVVSGLTEILPAVGWQK